MTALAQCLLDAGKQVRGWDVAEDFVTAPILAERGLAAEIVTPDSFASVDCLIYTAAHQGPANPIVQQAQAAGVPCYSHAQALGSLFDQKQGIAVCGVGGKSTTSAMITWILEQTGHQPSFAIGVGNIPGLEKTGQWVADSAWFVAEADEYAVDPAAPARGEQITPRFSYMHPEVAVCTNLKYDHPDVYPSFEATLAAYSAFFQQLKPSGHLLFSNTDRELVASSLAVPEAATVEYFGESETSDGRITDFWAEAGRTGATFSYRGQTVPLELLLPGKYNLFNAAAALMATATVGVELSAAAKALQTFRSTKRRAELVGEKNGITFYDDYAHHPDEIKHVIGAFRQWYPESQLVVAFQSHTFSRTKALFDEFVTAFDQADQVVMIDIFASAREAFDATVTSDMLCAAINQRAGTDKATNLQALASLAEYLAQLPAGSICLTLGAGDIYQVHDMVKV